MTWHVRAHDPMLSSGTSGESVCCQVPPSSRRSSTLVRRDLWSCCCGLLCSRVCYPSVIPKLAVFMIMSPCLNSNDRPLFCVVLCQVPTSSRRCCRSWTSCSVEKTCMRLIHRYLHTYIRIDNFIHTTVFTSRTFSPPPLSFLPSPSQLLHAQAHTHTRTHTHTSHTTYHHTTYSHLLFHTQITPHQSFTISFLFPAFPMPSLPFFCCLLEEVDMWGYPVL